MDSMNYEINEVRDLSKEEIAILTWLVENGNNETRDYIEQIPELRVYSKCACGCASINVSYMNKKPDLSKGMKTISDYYWIDENSNRFGIFIFSVEDIIAGLEVWSIDGKEVPRLLPNIESLAELKFE